MLQLVYSDSATPSSPQEEEEEEEGLDYIFRELAQEQETNSRKFDITVNQLQHWLCRFILEVRKKDGNPFPPNTLHHIACGIMRYLRINGKPGIDIFKDKEFARFRTVLDSEMKRLQSSGLGSGQRKAEPITYDEEEIMWEKGILGDHSPQSLIDTMFYMNGLYFALRGGKEHRNLRYEASQITLIEKPGDRSYLQYHEDVSKNHPGGLKGRKIKPKIVYHHANTEKPERCFVRLYKLYHSLCPSNRPKDAYYLQPLQKPKPDCWYSNRPVGHSKLDLTIKRLCTEAGLGGYRTNHSLRATAATRLHQSGCIEEQEIMGRPGHRSTEAVRSYKRASQEQLMKVSDILNGNPSKRQCLPLSESRTLSDTTNHPALQTTSFTLEHSTTTLDSSSAATYNISSYGCININNYYYSSK